MFSTTVKFLGLRPKATWVAAFKAAVHLPENLTLGDVPVALANCLMQWMTGSGSLATDAGYSAAERYCLRQAFLWKIYQAFEVRGWGNQVAEDIARCALDVVEETPPSGRPLHADALALSPFPQAELDHLKAVYEYYISCAPMAEDIMEGSEAFVASLSLPVSSQGFMCTVVLPADMNIHYARHLWRRFMQENTAVRLITLGADAAAREAAETADPIFFAPGGGQRPGRCLWAQPVALTPDIHAWLRQQGYTTPEKARCIVLKANGTLSSVLTTSDIIDDFAISDAFFNAC